MASTATPGVVTVKNNCSLASGQQINQTINLGSPTSPQMIYFKGVYDPSSNFVGVGVDGSQPIQGYGLLVVEDADLAFFQTGKFRWDGIVLVTGRNVAVAFKGDSDTEIRGALIGSETQSLRAGGLLRVLQPHDRHHAPPREQGEHRHGAPGPLQHAHHLVSGSMQFAAQLLVAVVAIGLVLGCQQAPARPTGGVSPSPAPPHVSRALELKAEGDALMAKADHRAAAEVYRRAAALDPDDMSIRFALGTAQSFLDQRREAVEAFRGVVGRGDPASVESP